MSTRDEHLWAGFEVNDIVENADAIAAQEFTFSGTVIKQTSLQYATLTNMIAGTDGRVYIAGGRYITGYNSAGQATSEYQVSGNAVGMAQGPNKDFYYTTCCNVVRESTAGVKRVFALPSTSDRVSQIAIDNSNRVWVVLDGSLSLLNPQTGHFTQYPISFNGRELVVGPDNNLWFATGATLSRISTSTPAVTHYTLPGTSNGFLADGLDGTIWTGSYPARSDAGLINVATNGKVLGTYTCPETACNPTNGDGIRGVASAGDGNIWFVYSGTVNIQPNPPMDPYSGIVAYIRFPMDVVPSSVSLAAVGQTQTLTVSEKNYTGSWTASSTQPTIIKVLGWTDPSHVRIQSVAKGSGRIIITDSKTNYVGVTVTVQ